MSFFKLHDKHVKDKRLACAECHSFQPMTDPRGLKKKKNPPKKKL